MQGVVAVIGDMAKLAASDHLSYPHMKAEALQWCLAPREEQKNNALAGLPNFATILAWLECASDDWGTISSRYTDIFRKIEYDIGLPALTSYQDGVQDKIREWDRLVREARKQRALEKREKAERKAEQKARESRERAEQRARRRNSDWRHF